MPNVVQRRVALLSDDGKFADSMTPQAVLDAVEHVDQAVADIEGDLAEMLAKSANLSDVPSPAAARANLGAAAVDHTHTPEQVIGLATALDAKADLVGGVIPTSQIPREAMGDTVVVASQAEMLALTPAQVQPGDIAIRTDGAGSFILKGADPSQLGSWVRLNSPTDAVTSVNGQIGDVTLSAANVGAATPQQVADAVGAVQIEAKGYADQAAGSATAAASSASTAATARTGAETARTGAETARDQTEAAVTSGLSWTGTVDLTTIALAPVLLQATLTGSVVINLPTPPASRAYTVTLVLVQDATGSRTITLPGVKWSGLPFAASTAVGAVDILHLLWTGTAWVGLIAGMGIA